jgi:hypothetical protein
MRRNLGGATQGLLGYSTNVYHVNDWDKAIAWQRWDQGGMADDVVVIANFANTTWEDYRIGFPHPGNWYCIFNSDAEKYDESYENLGPLFVETEPTAWDGFGQSASFVLPAYTALVFSRTEHNPPDPFDPADINRDGLVNGADLALVLVAWGTDGPDGDINKDGLVNGADLALILVAWTI